MRQAAFLLAILVVLIMSSVGIADSAAVKVTINFEGISYENETRIDWEYEIPDGGIRWDGNNDYIYVHYPQKEEIAFSSFPQYIKTFLNTN